MRTTKQDLENTINLLNQALDLPLERGPGHMFLDSAYGGFKLSQITKDNGGARCVTNTGYTTKKELQNEIRAFLEGIYTAKRAMARYDGVISSLNN